MKSFLVACALSASATAKTYVVKLVNTSDGDISGIISRIPNLEVGTTFSIGESFSAFTVDVDDISEIENDIGVEYVEEETEFELWMPTPEELEAQAVESWGLDRINQRNLPLDNNYEAPGSGGAGVSIYIIDSGVQTNHPEFGGRARFGFNGVGGTNNDVVGHGTHVAGTAGGSTFGVAPNSEIVSVKVCATNSCSLTGILSGVEFAANDSRGKKAVANMSLGGGRNSAIDDAVASAIASGLPIAVASGNSRRDACTFSPARVPTAVTVNASTIRDGAASFTNFGSCTDLYAPGQDITSAWINSGVRTISGTSMASPHVAGIMALYLAERDYTPAQLQTAILNAATQNVISNPRGDNLLAYYLPN